MTDPKYLPREAVLAAIERLRSDPSWQTPNQLLCLARDTISALPTHTGEVERLRSALKPFAFLGSPDQFNSPDGGCTGALIEDADVQRARTALEDQSHDR